jgi:hypothetical protein
MNDLPMLQYTIMQPTVDFRRDACGSSSMDLGVTHAPLTYIVDHEGKERV